MEKKEFNTDNLNAYLIRPQDKSVYLKKYFSYFSTKTCVVGTQKNLLIDGSFDHPKHMFKLMDKKIITILILARRFLCLMQDYTFEGIHNNT